LNEIEVEKLKEELTRDLKRPPSIEFGKCETKIDETDKRTVVRVKSLCGEITSAQARKLAEVSSKYGRGFIHIGVRGTPEIPYVKEEDIDKISVELKSVDLEILNVGVVQRRGFDNMITCFGEYCIHSNVNTQSLLRRIDQILKDIDFEPNEVFKISASGCPNNCGISPLSSIGFTGVVEVEVIPEKCNGCNLCILSCKVNAIKLVDKVAVIDKEKCKNCGECMRICPLDAIVAKRRGFLVYIGGKDYDVNETCLGEEKGRFLTEDKAVELVKREVIKFREE